ncbi:hypothetical protein AB833_03105 [Chromatiales bacterium (ex Bugula neritina AB1)]|nr:hypothetical protein AB833_03105 [Chromatiales bacterium (ex Bugula neritina AB1)]
MSAGVATAPAEPKQGHGVAGAGFTVATTRQSKPGCSRITIYDLIARKKMMKLKIFSLPAYGDEQAEEALNEFMAAESVVHMDRQLIQSGTSSYWSICVGYDQAQAKKDNANSGRIDYRKVLSPTHFREYSALREWRKNVSETENTTLYGVFTNAELAAIVQLPLETVAEIGSVDGVGEIKMERYSQRVFDLLQERRGKTADSDDA